MRRVEFIFFIASLLSIVAFSVDIILPAFDKIHESFGLINSNDRQLIVTYYLFGLGVSQLLFGPLADHYGKKKVLLLTIIGFMLTSIACTLVTDFNDFLNYRFLNGFSSGGPVVIALALIRDRYRGKAMSKVVSMAVSIFIMVPIFAPLLGQILLFWLHWKTLFYLLALNSLLMALWIIFRLHAKVRKTKRTLSPSKRNPHFVIDTYYRYISVFRHTKSMFLFIATGVMTGLMFSYISVSQQVFTHQYNAGDIYPVYFGVVASSIVISSLLNSRIVMLYGTIKIFEISMFLMLLLNAIYFIFSWLTGINLFFYILFQFLILFLLGLFRPNIQSKSLEPMGKATGSASAINGFIVYSGGGLVGTLIAKNYDGTIFYLALGNLVAVFVSFILVYANHYLEKR